MAVTYKDIDQLSQKSTVAGTEKIPVSDTQYLTPAQIATSKQVHLTDESGMPETPDEDTLYLIDDDGSSGGYTLPVASSSTLGGIKTGYSQSGKNFPVVLDNNNNAYVNVPFTSVVYLTSESQMPATPDSNTLYVILES